MDTLYKAKKLDYLLSYGVYEARLPNARIPCDAELYFHIYPLFESGFKQLFDVDLQVALQADFHVFHKSKLPWLLLHSLVLQVFCSL